MSSQSTLVESKKITSLTINLENCYGIKKLEYNDFVFKDKISTYTIYAPNGTMKTSFAKIFEDIQLGKESRDQVFTERQSIRNILKQNNERLSAEEVFVIKSYSEKPSSNVAPLLANEELRTNYENVIKNIENQRNSLLKKLAEGLKKKINQIETLLIADFNMATADIYVLLDNLISTSADNKYLSLKYDIIFDSKVINYLETNNIILEQIEQYTDVYNELLDNSNLFERDKFNHNGASSIIEALESTKFFESNHSVNLKFKTGIKSYGNQKELKAAIEEEKNRILNTPELQEKFEALNSKLKNKELKNLRVLTN
jgi:hypothetical protein